MLSAKKKEIKESNFKFAVGVQVFKPIVVNPDLATLNKIGVDYFKNEPDYSKKMEIWFEGVSPDVKGKKLPLTFWFYESTPNSEGEVKFEFMDAKGAYTYEYSGNLNDALPKLKETHQEKGWSYFDFSTAFHLEGGKSESLLIKLIRTIASVGWQQEVKKDELPYKFKDLSKPNPKNLNTFIKSATTEGILLSIPVMLSTYEKDGRTYVQEVLLNEYIYQVNGEEPGNFVISTIRKALKDNKLKIRDKYRFVVEPKSLTTEEVLNLFDAPDQLDEDAGVEVQDIGSEFEEDDLE